MRDALREIVGAEVTFSLTVRNTDEKIEADKIYRYLKGVREIAARALLDGGTTDE